MEHTPEELAHLIGDCTWGEAKLMLAAPALLTALEALDAEYTRLSIATMSHGSNRPEITQQARDAIEAATKGDSN